MKLKDLSVQDVKRLCKNGELAISIGPFNFAIQSPLTAVSENLAITYADFSLCTNQDIIDFHIRVDKPKSIRRWIRPQVYFYLDGQSPFLPLPASQAYPLLEWGMNWCIAQHSLHYLSLHAAVLEKNGCTVIMPAESGSGKSTLTAILANNGWRLLSDEMALIDIDKPFVTPLARPISLKNNAISLIQNHFPKAQFSEVVDDTNKGTIAHMKPSQESVSQIFERAKANTLIFPKFKAKSPTELTALDKADASMEVIKNSFNYGILGSAGFNALTALIENCKIYQFTYSDLQQAIETFEELSIEYDATSTN